jgi:hypothetical protein
LRHDANPHNADVYEFGARSQAVEVLLTLSGNRQVQDLCGRSPSEVFVTVVDWDFDQYACGGEFVLWFDGSQWHQF